MTTVNRCPHTCACPSDRECHHQWCGCPLDFDCTHGGVCETEEECADRVDPDFDPTDEQLANIPWARGSRGLT